MAAVPDFEEPLEKAMLVTHGSWGPLPIVAIGPKGGQIVGYAGGGKPIYAGSKQSYKLAAGRFHKLAPAATSVLDWLTQGIGVPAKLEKLSPQTTAVIVTEASSKLLEEHFPALKGKGHKAGMAVRYDAHHLMPYIGQALKPPTPEKQAAYAAKAAAGEVDHDPMPDLSTLVEVDAGKVKGSHGNRLFADPKGGKWVFKHENAPMARAEEAADRIARLILGPGKAPATKHVKLAGKSGTLIEFLPGKVLNDSAHSHPPLDVLKAHLPDVCAHAVIDWLVGNHDAHAGNFLVTPNGLAGFDKGQSWKFIGDDKLDPSYQPNNSKTIYKTFWNAVSTGAIDGAKIVPLIAKAIDKAETISTDQYESIIAPYAAAKSKQTGQPEVELRALIVGRLKSLRSDWEGFLQKNLGSWVKLKKKSEDNFETMPDAAPGEAKVFDKQPKQPVVTQKVAGWPLTKGSATIHHPGSPPEPGIAWPKGYPGPGFTSQVTYKKQNYTVEFMLHGGKEFGAFVTYPDGTVKEFSSPNDASDSLVLYHRKLPLNLTATERKKLSISYPAAVAFGIKKFATELSAAHSSPGDSLPEKFAIPEATTKEALAAEVKQEFQPSKVETTPTVDELYEELTGKKPKTTPPPAPSQPASVQEAKPVMDWGNAQHTSAGLKKEISKPFKYGGQTIVTITQLHDGKFQVDVPGDLGIFASISSAAKWTYLKQHGYDGDPADYKKKTGKPVPGVGWAYFGIKPQKPTIEMVTLPAAEYMAQAASALTFPEGSTKLTSLHFNDMQVMPVGTVLGWNAQFQNGPDKLLLKKTAEDEWTVTSLKTATNLAVGPAKTIWLHYWSVEDGGAYKIEPKKAGWKPLDIALPTNGWELLNAFVPGAKLRWTNGAGTLLIAMRDETNEGWSVSKPGEPATPWVANKVLASLQSAQSGVEVGIGTVLVTPSENNFETMPITGGWKAPLPDWHVPLPKGDYSSDIKALSPGTKLKVTQKSNGKIVLYTKIPTGSWIPNTGNALPAGDDNLIAWLNDASMLATFSFQLATVKDAPEPAAVPPTLDQMIDAPDGTLASLVYHYPGGPQTFVAKKISINTWEWTSNGEQTSTEDLYDTATITGGLKIDLSLQTPPAKPEKVAKPKKPKVTKTKADLLPVSGSDLSNKIKNVLPEAFHPNFDKMAEQMKVWVEPNGDLPAPAAKNPYWAAWVPPTGVLVEGEHAGKKYWLITSVVSYSNAGEAMKPVKFTIIDSEGNTHTSQHNPTTNANKALEDAGNKIFHSELAKKGPISIGSAEADEAIKTGFPTDAKTLKVMFKLDKAIFAAGETAKTIAEGTGPSSVPALPDVQKKAPQDMKGADAKKLVKVKATLADAFKAHFGPNAVTTEGSAVYLKIEGATTALPMAAWFEKHGLPSPYPVHVFSDGVTYLLPKEDAQQIVVTTLPQKQAASLPKISDDNWETMPEGSPQILTSDMGAAAIEEWLKKFPTGTTLKTTTTFTKLEDGGWKMKGGYSYTSSKMAPSIVSAKGVSVFAPGVDPEAEFEPESFKPKKIEKTPEQLAKIAKAKEVAAWAKEHKPVSDTEALHALAHVQKLAPGMKMWARMDGDDVLLTPAEKSDEAGFGHILDTLGPAKFKAVPSPLGDFYKISVADLKAAIPNKLADTIEGPDGGTYPAGTTFEEEKVPHTLQELLLPQIKKVSEFKGNPDLVMLKVAGTGDEQKVQLQKVLADFKLEAVGEIVIGGSNTMVAIKKAALDAIAKVDTVIKPVVPAQPPGFVAASLPSFGGESKDGEEGVVNRGDLAMMDSIKAPRSGHWVRTGKYGVWWNGQVAVRRVKAGGSYYWEVIGQLLNASLGDNHLTSGTVKFLRSEGTKYPHYNFPQHQYEEETGAAVQSEGVLTYGSYSGYVGATDAGSKIEVINSPQYPVMHGTVKIRIPDGKDIESELSEALQKAGIDPAKALAEPDEKDERMWKKHQVLRAALGPFGYRSSHLAQSTIESEELLDAKLAGMKLTGQMATTKIEHAVNGKQVVMINDEAKAQAGGVRFVYIGLKGGIGAAYARLREGAGAWSNRLRWWNGVQGNATSPDSDNSGGGSFAVFARFGNVNADGKDWGMLGHDVKLIFHPRVLRRADWYAFKNDSFGRWANDDAGVTRDEAFKTYVSSSHEVCFEDAISQRDLAGISVNDEDSKANLVKWSKAAGITEVNGIPIEQFILVNHDNDSRSQIANDLYGLKPGVLP